MDGKLDARLKPKDLKADALVCQRKWLKAHKNGCY
jgi:hypothetical protein